MIKLETSNHRLPHSVAPLLAFQVMYQLDIRNPSYGPPKKMPPRKCFLGKKQAQVEEYLEQNLARWRIKFMEDLPLMLFYMLPKLCADWTRGSKLHPPKGGAPRKALLVEMPDSKSTSCIYQTHREPVFCNDFGNLLFWRLSVLKENVHQYIKCIYKITGTA